MIGLNSTAAAGQGPLVSNVGNVGISFSGAGFLIFYYIGIVEVLTKLGVLHQGAQVAGASSGALIATSQCGGLTSQDILSAALSLARSCRTHKSCAGNLDSHLLAMLQTHLPINAWKQCKNSGWIMVSRLPVLPINAPQPELVSNFNSQADLLAAAAASAYIPLWSGSNLFAWFRGQPALDGGMSMFQPCPPHVQHCIKISSRNPAWKDGLPGQGLVSALTRLVGGSASPGSDERSANPAYPPISSTGDNGTADPNLLSLAHAKGVDIAPGVWNKMPFTPEQWTSWAYTPADDTTLMHMVALGRADAELWAKAKGLLRPAEQSSAASAPPSTPETSSAGAAGAGSHEHESQSRQEAGATAVAPTNIAQPAPAAGTMMRPHPGRKFGRLR